MSSDFQAGNYSICDRCRCHLCHSVILFMLTSPGCCKGVGLRAEGIALRCYRSRQRTADGGLDTQKLDSNRYVYNDDRSPGQDYCKL